MCGNCAAQYSGQTGKHFSKRLGDYKIAFQNYSATNSAMAKHCLEQYHDFSTCMNLQNIIDQQIFGCLHGSSTQYHFFLNQKFNFQTIFSRFLGKEFYQVSNENIDNISQFSRNQPNVSFEDVCERHPLPKSWPYVQYCVLLCPQFQFTLSIMKTAIAFCRLTEQVEQFNTNIASMRNGKVHKNIKRHSSCEQNHFHDTKC